MSPSARPALLATLALVAACSTQRKGTGEAPPPAPAPRVDVEVIEEGNTLGEALERMHVGRENAVFIVAGIERGVGLKNIRPGDTLRAFWRGDTLVRFSHTRRRRSFVLSARDSVGHFEEPNFRRAVERVKGVIENNLYTSLLSLGEKPALAVAFVDLLAWDIDFAVESQQGDSFHILVEKLYEGEHFWRYGRVLHAAYYGKVTGTAEAFYYATDDTTSPNGVQGDYYTSEGKSVQRMFLRSPLKVYHLTSGFSRARFHPILRVYRPHHGVDYGAPPGTPVFSVGKGTVVYAGWRGGYGNFVGVRHPNGYKTGYGHMRRIAKGIRVGTHVSQGQIVGYVGSTGLSTGPHLHFEVTLKGRFVNPMTIKPPPKKPLPASELPRFIERVKLLRRYAEAL